MLTAFVSCAWAWVTPHSFRTHPLCDHVSAFGPVVPVVLANLSEQFDGSGCFDALLLCGFAVIAGCLSSWFGKNESPQCPFAVSFFHVPSQHRRLCAPIGFWEVAPHFASHAVLNFLSCDHRDSMCSLASLWTGVVTPKRALK